MLSLNNIIAYIKGGSERSRNIKKNAIGAIAVKIIAMAIQLLQVPIVLSYLDSTLYGLYLTITSIVVWTHNFDFGLGSGLRYKLTEAIANKDYDRGKTLVSTSYISLAGIMLTVAICLIPAVHFFNWRDILNCNELPNSYLSTCVIVVLATLLIQFVLELITIVLQANQRAAISTVFKPLSNVVALIGVIVLKYTNEPSLLAACLMLTAPLVIVLLTANIILFMRKYRHIAPSLKYYRTSVMKDIYSLGVKFFITSLSGVIVYNSTSIIISHYLNPFEVTVYNIAYTYFSLFVVFHGVFLTPVWAGITDAWVKKDIPWLRACMKRIAMLTAVFSLFIIIALCISKFAFHIWIGDKVSIPGILSTWLALYFVLNLWSATYNCFVVGVGKAQLSMYLSFFKIIAFIPMLIAAVNYYGLIGVVIATILINTIPNVLFGYLQYNRLINNKATGVLNK